MGNVRKTVHLRPQTVENLRIPLQKIYDQFTEEYLPSDPLKFPYLYSDPLDRELIAFVAALLAFGGVKAIFGTIEKIILVLGKAPVEKVKKGQFLSLDQIYHRWVTGKDLVVFFKALQEIYNQEGSLQNFFGFTSFSLKKRLEDFSKRFRQKIFLHSKKTRGLQFLIPSPQDKSACKRMNLFLRWVVRSDPPDLGLWKNIQPSELFLPIDVHLGRIVRYIGLTHKKSVNWGMVQEVSQHLRTLYPKDPIRFDFGIARLGILKRCKHRWHPPTCHECSFLNHCSLAKGGSK